jgi:hypothetical protein
MQQCSTSEADTVQSNEKFPATYGTRGSTTMSTESTTGVCPEPDESSPYARTPLFWDQF